MEKHYKPQDKGQYRRQIILAMLKVMKVLKDLETDDTIFHLETAQYDPTLQKDHVNIEHVDEVLTVITLYLWEPQDLYHPLNFDIIRSLPKTLLYHLVFEPLVEKLDFLLEKESLELNDITKLAFEPETEFFLNSPSLFSRHIKTDNLWDIQSMN